MRGEGYVEGRERRVGGTRGGGGGGERGRALRRTSASREPGFESSRFRCFGNFVHSTLPQVHPAVNEFLTTYTVVLWWICERIVFAQ